MAGPSHDETDPQSKQPRYASWYNIAPTRFTGIEHPFIVRNVEKGIQTLGGISAVSKLVQNTKERPDARLYFKPGNRESKPVSARLVKTSDVVLKVTVPKRTGRKRKRGSDDPFEASNDDLCHETSNQKPNTLPVAPAPPKASYVLRSLRDNEEKYEVEAVGHVEETHRFRALPDFVFSTKKNGFMQKLRDTTLSFEYEKIKQFEFDKSIGVKRVNELVPPPQWNYISTPFNYNYHQNPGVKAALEPSGNTSFVADGMPVKQHNQHTACDSPSIPTSPSPLVPPLSSLDPAMQRIITQAQHLFTTRPIWTRRALYNSLSQADMKSIGWNGAKYIQQYCGYSFDSGPWRDAIVRFGTDPRTDIACRVYQTLQFQLESTPMDNRGKGLDSVTKQDRLTVSTLQERESHLFDGVHVYTDGKVWQVCDITDPLLQNIFSHATLREKCHVTLDGWFQNGAYAKARVLMKHKIKGILEGNPLGEEVFKLFENVPDVLNEATRKRFTLGRTAMRMKLVSQFQIYMLGEMRTAALRSKDPEERVEEGSEEEGEEEADGKEEEEEEMAEKEDEEMAEKGK